MSGAVLRTALEFDFSSLASPPTIPSSATLSLWETAEYSSNARTLRVYRLKRAWVESQITWNIYSTGNNWSSAGGFHVDDCEQTEIASRAFSATEANGEKQWTNFDLTLLRDMWDGTWTNNGWLLKADTELDDAYAFRSSDNTTSAERPKMVIVYTIGTAYDQSVEGGITPAGTLVKMTARVMAGSITPVGALTRLTGKIFSGAITPIGALVKTTLKTLAGAITPVGTLVKNIGKILSGGITPIGTLVMDVAHLIRVFFGLSPTSDIITGAAPTEDIEFPKE